MNLATNVPVSARSTRESPEKRLDRILRAQQEAFVGNPYPSAEERIALMKRVPDMLLATGSGSWGLWTPTSVGVPMLRATCSRSSV